MSVHRLRAMGCEVVVAGVEPERVAAVLERWEAAFSLFRAESELSRVNRSQARVVVVSELFASALRVALDAVAASGGLVDPTLGVGWGDVSLSGRLLSRPPGRLLDLNGVVKALAVDDAAGLVEDGGFVSVGGDLAVRGAVDVGLPGGGAVRVVEGGLATSGTASRGSHLIDPRTGRPSRSRWSQVTASGASCLEADVAAKAAYLLDADGPDWLDGRGMPGRFLGEDGEPVLNASWFAATAERAACT
ncbi:MAG TPA: FAD:protein FMN transferase [Gaiellaceae bacterium]|nr:FAD:protein FMN transferase [Gaiellaceae bacterium]